MTKRRVSQSHRIFVAPAALLLALGVSLTVVPAHAATAAAATIPRPAPASTPEAQRASEASKPAQPGTAQAFVEQNIEKGYQILRDTKASKQQREATFHDFLLGLMDARRIGMFTLGQYANGASKADIEAFVAAFTDYTAAVYETRLNKYKDQVLKVTGTQARAADDVVVSCDVTDPKSPNDPPYKVSFRIRKGGDGRFIVTDMNIEGIWQTLSQRADFAGFLQQHGGRVSDLTNDLKTQVTMLYANG